MKLLIVTQKIDSADPGLGFFHRWVEVFSKNWESITVICLYMGEHNLPANVKVLSLGKEKGESKFKYIKNFYRYIWSERKNYDRILIHMNQEYILIGGLFLKILGKKIFMWRNHHSGSLLTDIAASFCTKVFCTSRFSYTAKYKKTEFMPVGVDIDNFKPLSSVTRIPRSILSLGRITPSKNIDVLVDGIIEINDSEVKVDIYGDPLPQDQIYNQQLKEKAGSRISFYPGISNTDTIPVYSSHDIFVNLSSSGMYDKTILEAMACGCLILASNDNLRGQIRDDFIFKQRDTEELVRKLKNLLNYNREEREIASHELQTFAYKHSLGELGDKLLSAMK